MSIENPNTTPSPRNEESSAEPSEIILSESTDSTPIGDPTENLDTQKGTRWTDERAKMTMRLAVIKFKEQKTINPTTKFSSAWLQKNGFNQLYDFIRINRKKPQEYIDKEDVNLWEVLRVISWTDDTMRAAMRDAAERFQAEKILNPKAKFSSAWMQKNGLGGLCGTLCAAKKNPTDYIPEEYNHLWEAKRAGWKDEDIKEELASAVDIFLKQHSEDNTVKFNFAWLTNNSFSGVYQYLYKKKKNILDFLPEEHQGLWEKIEYWSTKNVAAVIREAATQFLIQQNDDSSLTFGPLWLKNNGFSDLLTEIYKEKINPNDYLPEDQKNLWTVRLGVWDDASAITTMARAVKCYIQQKTDNPDLKFSRQWFKKNGFKKLYTYLTDTKKDPANYIPKEYRDVVTFELEWTTKQITDSLAITLEEFLHQRKISPDLKLTFEWLNQNNPKLYKVLAEKQKSPRDYLPAEYKNLWCKQIDEPLMDEQSIRQEMTNAINAFIAKGINNTNLSFDRTWLKHNGYNNLLKSIHSLQKTPVDYIPDEQKSLWEQSSRKWTKEDLHEITTQAAKNFLEEKISKPTLKFNTTWFANHGLSGVLRFITRNAKTPDDYIDLAYKGHWEKPDHIIYTPEIIANTLDEAVDIFLEQKNQDEELTFNQAWLINNGYKSLASFFQRSHLNPNQLLSKEKTGIFHNKEDIQRGWTTSKAREVLTEIYYQWKNSPEEQRRYGNLNGEYIRKKASTLHGFISKNKINPLTLLPEEAANDWKGIMRLDELISADDFNKGIRKGPTRDTNYQLTPPNLRKGSRERLFYGSDLSNQDLTSILTDIYNHWVNNDRALGYGFSSTYIKYKDSLIDPDPVF